jgi:hypothetical protein
MMIEDQPDNEARVRWGALESAKPLAAIAAVVCPRLRADAPMKIRGD